jgi:MGT family glycosyltransferase
MARFLFYSSPARGHLYPVVPTVSELRARGHEVVLRTLSAEVDRLRSLGFEADPIDPEIERLEPAPWITRTPLDGLWTALQPVVGRFRRARPHRRRAAAEHPGPAVVDVVERAPHDGRDLRRALQQERPDAVVVDVNAWGAIAVAGQSGLPFAAWCPCFTAFPSREAPPYGPGFAPAAGPLGRLRDRVAGRMLLARKDLRLRALNEVRHRLGAPQLASLADVPLEPPLLLYFTAEPLEYHRSDWPPGVRLVGPGVWSPPEDAPSWLEEIERPLVLVTCSTEYQDDGRLVETALTALADEPVEVVATTGAVDPGLFTAPPNARVVRFVSHDHLLDRAACVICHGGMGVTQKALSAGVPVCVVPFGRDQRETARRVEIAGVGTRLRARRLQPERLRTAVSLAMTRQDAARAMAKALAAAGGPRAAADALEGILRPAGRS